MSDDFKPGLEGVVAFETEIAEPDKEGGALRYRGIDIEELVGKVPYEQVWGLLVDDSFEPGMPRAEDVPLPVSTGSVMAASMPGPASSPAGMVRTWICLPGRFGCNRAWNRGPSSVHFRAGFLHHLRPLAHLVADPCTIGFWRAANRLGAL